MCLLPFVADGAIASLVYEKFLCCWQSVPFVPVGAEVCPSHRAVGIGIVNHKYLMFFYKHGIIIIGKNIARLCLILEVAICVLKPPKIPAPILWKGY